MRVVKTSSSTLGSGMWYHLYYQLDHHPLTRQVCIVSPSSNKHPLKYFLWKYQGMNSEVVKVKDLVSSRSIDWCPKYQLGLPATEVEEDFFCLVELINDQFRLLNCV